MASIGGFIRYKPKRHPYMTPVMTGGAMGAVVKAKAGSGASRSAAAISDYAGSSDPFNTHRKPRNVSDYKAVVEMGPIWSPSSGGGPRITARYGVEGPDAYVIEFGGIYTPATHALRRSSGVRGGA